MDTVDPKLHKLGQWKQEAESDRSQYDNRWARNLKLVKGIFQDDTKVKSTVRDRNKIFFRKIWATVWRVVASFYYAFLRDKDTFKIEGRDTQLDPKKAKILQTMVEYRRDQMMSKRSLFIKFIWAFQNIMNLGLGVGKVRWVYNEELGEDYPDFMVYPNEQVLLDLRAQTKEEMRFIGFINYLTKEEMEALGYENLDELEETSPQSNIVRQTRQFGKTDPMQNPGPNEYPTPGSYEDDQKEGAKGVIGSIEWFYKKDGYIYTCVSSLDCQVWHKKESISPYGDTYPVVLGQCLTEPHMLVGEGLPEPLEGPQESYNYNLNMRKDNIALALNHRHIVSRWANVDYAALTSSRMGGIVLADDPLGVQSLETKDVTQSSYMEAAADDAMMQEMSGVTAGKVGMEKAEKATVAQINFTEANAKIELYVAMVAETFVRDFYTLLAEMIQRFETDENIFRIANDSYRRETGDFMSEDIYDLDFEADCIMNVGMGVVGREREIQQILLVMDRAIMANQASAALIQAGIPARMVDITQIVERLLPKLGFKDLQKLFVMMPGAQQQGQGQQGGLMPQMGAQLPPANQLQAGSLGGL